MCRECLQPVGASEHLETFPAFLVDPPTRVPSELQKPSAGALADGQILLNLTPVVGP